MAGAGRRMAAVGPALALLLAMSASLANPSSAHMSPRSCPADPQPGQAPGSRDGSCALPPPLMAEPGAAHGDAGDVCDDATADFVGEAAGAGRYIVRFRDYRMQREHEVRVAALLGGPEAGAASWLRRRNKAAAHPTDFGLMAITPGRAGEAVKELLLAQPWVKAIGLDRQLTRSLTWGADESGGGGDGDGSSSGATEGLRVNRACAGEEGGAGCLQKPPGRLLTRPTLGLHGRGDDDPGAEDAAANATAHRRLLFPVMGASSRSVTKLFEADKLWAAGYKGAGIRMGVFDTGVRSDHPAVKNVKERSNWTHEPTLADGLGHGSFVAGVISSIDPNCPGFAPEVDLHTFRVFTNDQVSYTSWFLDAFNYAIATEMHIVNLSIGGPDYLDEAFVDKVMEITSNGLIMVSAIGNDGPHYGTLNNPADQNDVIAVGGIDFQQNIASFSSRGMSTWELPGGYGRAKPDVTAYGKDVSGSKIQGGCRTLSGTSVASPVVAGAVCLLASVVPAEARPRLLNPASMKQALVEGAVPGPGQHMYEQGQGRMSVINSMAILKTYKPRASAVPAKVDLTNCPFMWPFCKQSLFADAMPVVINMTVLNGMGVQGDFEGRPVFIPDSGNGKYLQVDFAHSERLWPWSGFLALYLTVSPEGRSVRGQASGRVEFTIKSPPYPRETATQTSKVSVPVKVNIIPTPPREQRVLWDQFHSIRYPPGYIPRDNLDVHADILDWHGDHPHTNFKDMYNFLTDAGYFVEVLGRPFTCFDAQRYGTLMLVDSEEEYYSEEVHKLQADVAELGMGLLVFGEWYNRAMMEKMRFYDDNTRSWWTPYTGGANVPALNDLLAPYGIALGEAVLTGTVALGGSSFKYLSGASLNRFPMDGHVHRALLSDRAPGQATAGAAVHVSRFSGGMKAGAASAEHPVLGLTSHGKGRIAVMGDASCLDSSHQVNNCFILLRQLLEFTSGGRESTQLFTATTRLHEPLGSIGDRLPQRRVDVNFKDVSTVLNFPATCDEAMDAKAWELRTRFMHTTQETALLAQRGVGDYGHLPAPPGDASAVEGRDAAAAAAVRAEEEQQPVLLEDPPDPVVQRQNEVMAKAAQVQTAMERDMRLRAAGGGPRGPPSHPAGHHGRAESGTAGQAARPQPLDWTHIGQPHDHGVDPMAGQPLIMGKGDGIGLRDLPNFSHVHFSHGLAVAGAILVLLLWRVSRRSRSGTPTHRAAGNQRAYRRIFGR
mmetsp:Transcript_40415/g.102302  ORF Transcript_40415/g.102302 Transcript_40415/m.102302 type:complete len:1225 (-) Transcript_40415:14-3688(-)